MNEEDWQAVLKQVRRGFRSIGRSDLADIGLYDIEGKGDSRQQPRALSIAMLEELLVELYARSPGLEQRSMDFIRNPDRDKKSSETPTEDSYFEVDHAVTSLQYLIEFIKSIDAEGEEK